MPNNQSNGYRIVFLPSHKRAYKNGTVYEHVLVAERMLGRELMPQEVVHHKDRDRLNNNPNNLIVFANSPAHTRFHSNGCDDRDLLRLESGAYECVDRKRQHGNKCSKRKDDCPVCNGVKSVSASVCIKCRRVINACGIPERDTLTSVIIKNNGNFTAVSREYNVTDNAVRKWCKKYKIPYKSSDYRQPKVE